MLLLVDPTFSLRRELSRGFSLLTFASILAVFAIGGGAVAYWVAQHHPDWFLEFPRNRPDTYWTIMLLYPTHAVGRARVHRRPRPLLLHPASASSAGADEPRGMATGLLFALRYAVTRSFCTL